MTFALPTLLWLAPPLVAATVALHLWRLRRRKRVPWAAMEFLLASERRNRRWVQLREWLLIAARALVVLLAVVALARPRLSDPVSQWLGRGRVTHLVVLDDSYSMTEGGPGGSPWQAAIAALDHVVAAAARAPGARVVVCCASDYRDGSPDPPPRADARDPAALEALRGRLAEWKPAYVGGGLARAAAAAARVEGPPAERVVRLLSDLRRAGSDPPDALAPPLIGLRKVAENVQVLSCAASARPNLAVSRLRVDPGPLAAGVELTMTVGVTNHGPSPVAGALVALRSGGLSMPAVRIPPLGPGQTVTQRFPVRFPHAGPLGVTARVEADAIEADNTRHAAPVVVTERRLLLVDGSGHGREGLTWARALRPAERVLTGWRPEVVTPREWPPQPDLAPYAAVALLDVPRLGPGQVESVRRHVAAGRGLLIVAGPAVDPAGYNTTLLGDAPQPLARVRLGPTTQPEPGYAPPESGELVPGAHPLMGVFQGDRSAYLRGIAIPYYRRLGASPDAQPPSASPPPAESAFVAARHACGAPLLVADRPLGGDVAVLLTSAGQAPNPRDSWSNLGLQPFFPVLANEAAAWLARGSIQSPSLGVSDPWSRVVGPLPPNASVEVTSAGGGEAEPPVPVGRVRGDDLQAAPDRPGLYALRGAGRPGSATTLVACNVDPREGATALYPRADLRAELARSGIGLGEASDLLTDPTDAGKPPMAPLLASCAMLLLVAERLLSYAPRAEVTRAEATRAEAPRSSAPGKGGPGRGGPAPRPPSSRDPLEPGSRTPDSPAQVSPSRGALHA